MPTSLKKKAVFLDRDGTIIDDCGFITGVDEVKFFPFTIKALQMLQKEFLLFIVTNQSGVGLGKITLESARHINSYITSHLEEHGIIIQKVYCCSHKRDDNCNCIKPKPYFLNEARECYDIDLSESFTIGDHPHDVTFGTSAGARGLYVLTGHGEKHRSDCPLHTETFANLMDATYRMLSIPSS
jgi:histidinol-phosphate phosphatase family protein